MSVTFRAGHSQPDLRLVRKEAESVSLPNASAFEWLSDTGSSFYKFAKGFLHSADNELCYLQKYLHKRVEGLGSRTDSGINQLLR